MTPGIAATGLAMMTVTLVAGCGGPGGARAGGAGARAGTGAGVRSPAQQRGPGSPRLRAALGPVPATPDPAAACGIAPVTPPTPRAYSSEPALTIDPAARYTMVLQTSCGVMQVALDARRAPQAVNALHFLAARHFYDATSCDREVNTASVALLECGDPTGTGSGGPGFTLPEEHLAGATYPPGTLAMARTSAPHSTGSQFFLVGTGAGIPPEYTVVGRLTAGLPVLRRILALGDDGSFGPGDGLPRRTVYLFTVQVHRVGAPGTALPG